MKITKISSLLVAACLGLFLTVGCASQKSHKRGSQKQCAMKEKCHNDDGKSCHKKKRECPPNCDKPCCKKK